MEPLPSKAQTLAAIMLIVCPAFGARVAYGQYATPLNPSDASLFHSGAYFDHDPTGCSRCRKKTPCATW